MAGGRGSRQATWCIDAGAYTHLPTVPSSLEEGLVTLTTKNKSPPLSVGSLPEPDFGNSAESRRYLLEKCKIQVERCLVFLAGGNSMSCFAH